MCNSAKHNTRPGRSSKWITPVRRMAIYLRDGFTCAYCGTDLTGSAPSGVTLDHLVPRCKGGTHDSANLVTACARCNFSRQDTVWYRYAPEGAKVRIRRLVRRKLNYALANAVRRGEVPKTVAALEANRGEV